MKNVDKLIYFDSLAYFGKWTPEDKNQLLSTERLLSEMKRFSLMVHTIARYYDLVKDNSISIEESKKHPGIFPCFVLMLDLTKEISDLENYISENEIRAVKLYPKPNEFSYRKIFKLLEIKKTPLLIETGRRFNHAIFEEVEKVCLIYPNLKTMIQGARREEARRIFMLMKKFENIYIEISSFQLNNGIEFPVENFGSKRIIFGSGFPLKSIGSAKTFIDYSNISDEDKANIAELNLAKLLKSEQIISDYTPLIKSSPLEIYIRNKSLGIKKCCVSSWLSIWLDHWLENEIILNAVESFPEYFIGYASFNPICVKDWACELEHWFVVKKFKVIRPYYRRTEIPYNDKRWAPLFDFGNKNYLFALLHPSDNFVSEVKEISSRYSNLNFLLVHTGMSLKHARDLVEIAKIRKNVFLELTFTEVPDGLIEYLVDEVGAEKFIFGTDQPMRDQASQLGWIIYSEYLSKIKKKSLV